MKIQTLVAIGILLLQFQTSADVVPKSLRKVYSQRITGLDLRNSELNNQRDLTEEELFTSLFENVGFLEYRIATFASGISNEQANPFEDSDDFQVVVARAIVDDIDFRNIFDKNFKITNSLGMEILADGSNQYEENLNNSFGGMVAKIRLNILKTEAERTTSYGRMTAFLGLFTTRGFGLRNLSGGTNRRAVRAIWNNLLCSPIDEWRDAGLDRYYIGQDVSLSPSGKTKNFVENCASCHAGIDSQRGFSAFLDYEAGGGNFVQVLPKVSDKFKTNASTNPEATHTTTDDSWVNQFTSEEYQKRYGWRWPVGEDGYLHGKGVLQYGSMIANSFAFQKCMTKNLLKSFCDLTNEETFMLHSRPDFLQLANTLRDRGYKMKTFIKDIVKSEICLKRK